MVLAVAAKAWLDAGVLRTLVRGDRYGEYRRWLTVGAVGYGWIFTQATPEVGVDATARGVASIGACFLAILCGWLQQHKTALLGEQTPLQGQTLSRQSSWGTGHSFSSSRLPAHQQFSVWSVALSV